MRAGHVERGCSFAKAGQYTTLESIQSPRFLFYARLSESGDTSFLKIFCYVLCVTVEQMLENQGVILNLEEKLD